MATTPLPIFQKQQPQARRELPDYLPARMVNEYVYCPRLFFYEWVDGVFRESSDTVEGSAQHKRVDKPGKALPAAEEVDEETKIHTRSVMLSSEEWKVIAKLDVLEVADGTVTPVDYKRGRPKEGMESLDIWPADRVQLALQGLILRENGYRCEEGVIYYQTTKQRVRLEFTEEVMRETLAAVAAAWELARTGSIPEPLDGSPKCVGCSLAPICLPDEVTRLAEMEAAPEPDPRQLVLFALSGDGEGGTAPKKPALGEMRRLVTPRDDLRPVYLDTQGLRVGRSGGVAQVKDKDRLVQEIRLNEVNQFNVMGNIQLTTQLLQSLCEAGIPVCFFSQGGWFYGIAQGLSTKNVFLRQRQFALAGEPAFCRALARKLVVGKIQNQRTFLMRNHVEPPPLVLSEMKKMAERADLCSSAEELLGIEGNAARLYFGAFSGLLKVLDEGGEEDGSMPGTGGFRFDFAGRNRRPPRDPVNALLSLGYSMLAKDLTVACYAVGFDPMMGFYHQPRFGRPSLALDLMEPFRPLIVDSAVVNAMNTKMVTPRDFFQVGESVALKPEGRKAFYRAYELRMDQMVTHPLFDYRVSYRRMLEIQARLLAKVLEGEIGSYPVFVTR